MSNRPRVLPFGRRLPFLALQNVGVRDRAPHNTATPLSPEHTSPEHPLEDTPRGHPGGARAPPWVSGALPAPGRLRAPPPPGAAPRGPLGRARFPRPRGPARAALRSVGRSGRPRPVPRAPRPRPPRYLPAEPHDPVQLGLILKQVPELPGAEDPKAPRAAGLRPRPRRPGPVHAARPRPQLGCWLGPLGPLRPGSAPLGSGSGIRLWLPPRAALRRQRAHRPLLKGPRCWGWGWGGRGRVAPLAAGAEPRLPHPRARGKAILPPPGGYLRPSLSAPLLGPSFTTRPPYPGRGRSHPRRLQFAGLFHIPPLDSHNFPSLAECQELLPCC